MAVLLDKSGNTSGAAKFGGASGVRSRTASQFTPTANWTVTDIDVRINEDTGNPTGDVQIQILGDNGSNLPDNTNVLGTATIAAADADVGLTFTDFNRSFSASINLTSGTKYWVVLRVASGESDSHYYSSRAVITGGTGAKFNEDGSGVWASNADDLFYKLNGTVSGGGAPSKPTLLSLGVG